MRNMLSSNKILHNRFVLYFILFLALSDLLFLAMGSEYISVAVFVLSGFVTSFFSKNMMVVMCVAMVITNILRYGTGIRLMEGLKEGESDKKDTPETTTPDATETAPAAATETTPPATAPAPAATETATPAAKTPPAAATKMDASKEQKFIENMEKLESYQPLLESLDRLMEGVGDLIKL